MEEMQLGESVALDMEEMIVQQMMTESMMDMLTDKQKELIYALYFEKQTYQEYARYSWNQFSSSQQHEK